MVPPERTRSFARSRPPDSAAGGRQSARRSDWGTPSTRQKVSPGRFNAYARCADRSWSSRSGGRGTLGRAGVAGCVGRARKYMFVAGSPVSPRPGCGYNNHMTQGPVAGSRELKTHLGRYLQRAPRRSRSPRRSRRALAELRPVGAADATASALRKLAAAGTVTLPDATTPRAFPPIRPRTRGNAAALVRLDPDERG